MHKEFILRTWVSFAALIALFLAPVTLASQPGDSVSFARGGNRIPVTIVMAEGNGVPVILRRSSVEPRNVILINPTTTETQLGAAIFAFLLTEARDPEGRERGDNAAIRVTVPQSTPRYPGAAAALQRLRNASRRSIRGLTAGAKSVEIWVSPRRGRHR